MRRHWQRVGAAWLFAIALGAAAQPAPAPQPPALDLSQAVGLRTVPSGRTFPVSDALALKVLAMGELTGALLVHNDGWPMLRIRSHPVRTETGTQMFYPLVTLLGPAGDPVRTLKPRFELAQDQDTLVNDFDLPPEAGYFLVHSSKEFWDSGFEGWLHYLGPRPATVGAALGGIIGALAMDALTSMARRDARSFTFGKAGLVSFEQGR